MTGGRSGVVEGEEDVGALRAGGGEHSKEEEEIWQIDVSRASEQFVWR